MDSGCEKLLEIVDVSVYMQSVTDGKKTGPNQAMPEAGSDVPERGADRGDEDDLGPARSEAGDIDSSHEKTLAGRSTPSRATLSAGSKTPEQTNPDKTNTESDRLMLWKISNNSNVVKSSARSMELDLEKLLGITRESS